MDFSLTDKQREIQKIAADFADRELVPYAAKWEREHAFPTEALKKAAKLGFAGMDAPKSLGGSELGPVCYSLALTEVARGCAATAVSMSVNNMVAELVCKFGTKEQHEKYLAKLCSGEYVTGSFALTEPGAGSDARNLKARAVDKGDHYLLNGQKVFITSGESSPFTVVMALTGEPKAKQISAFIVERDYPGYKVGKLEQKMGLLASTTVELIFEDCKIPKSQLLGKLGQGFKIAMIGLDGGRIGISSQSIGIAQAAFKTLQQKVPRDPHLDELQADIDAARWLTLRAAWLQEQGQSFTRQASMAKLFSTEMGNRVCERALRIAGIEGQLNDLPLERHYRDIRATTLYEGTSEIQKMVIARSLIKEGLN